MPPVFVIICLGCREERDSAGTGKIRYLTRKTKRSSAPAQAVLKKARTLDKAKKAIMPPPKYQRVPRWKWKVVNREPVLAEVGQKVNGMPVLTEVGQKVNEMQVLAEVGPKKKRASKVSIVCIYKVDPHPGMCLWCGRYH